MRRYFMLVAAGTAAVLSVVGCGSDSDGGTPTPTKCLGNNAEFTPAEFKAQTQPGMGCSSDSDVNTVCLNDMPKVAGACGLDCLSVDNQEECIATCIQGEVTHGNAKALSETCLTCYGEDIACARDNCLIACATPTSTNCATCRAEKGCAAAFYGCSGLPEPSAD